MLIMAIPEIETFGSSIVWIYSPGTNIYGSRGGEFEGIGSMQGVESCKTVFQWGHFLFTSMFINKAS